MGKYVVLTFPLNVYTSFYHSCVAELDYTANFYFSVEKKKRSQSS